MTVRRALAAALLTGLIATASASAEQFAYTSGYDDGDVHAGRISFAGDIAVLLSSPYSTSSANLEGIAVDPRGRRVITVGDDDPGIHRFNIGGNGALSDSGSQELNDFPYGVVATPDGKYAYAAVTGSDEIRGFRLDRGGFDPTAQTLVVADNPTGLAVSSDGKYLYATGDLSTTGPIHAYRIVAGGRLKALPDSPFDTGANPFAISLTPDGDHLYVADRDFPAFIHAYDVAGDGSLTELASSPYPADGDNPFGMTIAPGGEHLYTANYGSDTISGFAIGEDGSLTDLPGSVYPGPDNPTALTFNARGFKLYAVSGDDPMSVYDVGSDGVPTGEASSLFGAIGDFQSIAFTPAQPPKAALKAKVDGLKVEFSAKKSKDDGFVIEHGWKFGDGLGQFTMGPKITHKYKKPGKYKVTLTLTDDEGCSTKYVATGQTAYCNGSKVAKTTEKIKVG